MKNMPKMVEEYHAKMRALRKEKREKKVSDAERIFYVATGKEKIKPDWLLKLEEEKKKKGPK